MEKKLKVGKKTYAYENSVTAGTFQELCSIMSEYTEMVGAEGMTSGKLIAILAEKKILHRFISRYISVNEKEVLTFPMSAIVEVMNDFFFTNGFWFAISGIFSMPSDVVEEIEKMTSSETQSQNQELDSSQHGSSKSTHKETLATTKQEA